MNYVQPKPKSREEASTLRHSAKSRILALALAVALLLGVMPTYAAEGVALPDQELAAGTSLGMSLGASFASLRSLSSDGTVLTVVVDSDPDVTPLTDRINELLFYDDDDGNEQDKLSPAEKLAVTTLRIEVGAGFHIDDFVGSITNLNSNLENLIRLEIFFEDYTNSTIPGDTRGRTFIRWLKELETNAETIGEYAFYHSDSLKIIKLENAVEIKAHAFRLYTGSGTLNELYIPKCEKIGNLAFNNWTALVGQMTIDNPELNGSDGIFTPNMNWWQTNLITMSGYPKPNVPGDNFTDWYDSFLFQSVDGITYFADGPGSGQGEIRILPPQTERVPAHIQLALTNPPSPGGWVTFDVVPGKGELPDGLELDRDTGVISGTPTSHAPSENEFTLRIQSSHGFDYEQPCSLKIPRNYTTPEVLHINIGLYESDEDDAQIDNETNIPADPNNDDAKTIPQRGMLRIAFSELMDKDVAGTVELRWNNTLSSKPLQTYHWNSEKENELNVYFSDLEPGEDYWIYVSGFKSANGITMKAVNQYANWGFTVALTPEYPQVTPLSQILDVGETAEFHLTMGVGDLKADYAEIIPFGDGITVLSPTTTRVDSDCVIEALGTGEGVKELRINFYKNGEVSPVVSVKCSIYFRDYYKIEVSADPPEWGIVEGAADAAPSDERHEVIAIPQDGYRFLRWSENGETVSLNSSYYFTPERNRSLVAHFTYVRHPYQVLVQAEPPEGGTVTGTADLLEGDVHTVTAEPAYGYRFVHWAEFGEEVSRDPEYTFTVNKDRYLTAIFSPYYGVEVSALPSVGGLVFGNADLPAGTVHTITAQAHPDFRFLYWVDLDDGKLLSYDPIYTFTITEEEYHYQAHFQLRPQPHESSRISPYQDDVTETEQAVTAMALKSQLPSSAFAWDGDENTLVIDHEGLTPADLLSVEWDGVPTTAYVATAGSVVIRFDDDFIQALSPGQHTVRVEFAKYYGEVIIPIGTPAADGNLLAGDGNNHNPETGGYTTGSGNGTATGSPNTWMALLPGSLGGAVLALRRWRQLQSK